MLNYRLFRYGPTVFIVVSMLIGSCKKRENQNHTVESSRQITTKTGVEMVFIPGGEFIMGDRKGEDDEKPTHKVKISAFYMDKYEVTQKAYESLMGKNPAKFKGPNKPVEQISWLGAVRYCNMRSLREGFTACYDPQTMECNYQANGYRLPTEAEWEYACRAGTDTRYCFGNDSSKLKLYSWFKDNAHKSTHPVGQKKPNPWGLFDIHGNVWEWCNDYYNKDYYSKSRAVDPCGHPTGQERALRGGSWANTADSCRCAARYKENPGLVDVCFGYEAYGFRCVKKVDPESPTEKINKNDDR